MKNIFSFFAIILFTVALSQTSTVTLETCDDDNDGIAFFDLNETYHKLNQEYNKQVGSEDEVYLATAGEGLAKISSISTNPTYKTVCYNSENFYEVAVNQNFEIFVSTKSGLYQIDEVSCKMNLIGNLPERSNIAMSFDTQDNLYVGGFHSKIYRADAKQFSNFYKWHDFGQGQSAGDFVVIGETMYIAWSVNKDCFLYEITLDDDFQFVSYKNLGMLPRDTYGMAAENGILYGVTPQSIYQINLGDFSTQMVLNNNTTSKWWGAAGLHEAQNLVITFHDSLDDANKKINIIPTNVPYKNQSRYNDKIYARVTNENNGNFSIIEINLIVKQAEEINPISLEFCKNQKNDLINVSTLIEQLKNIRNDLEFEIYQANPFTDTSSLLSTKSSVPLSENDEYFVKFIPINTESCSGYTQLNFKFSDISTTNLLNSYSICEGEVVTLNVGNFSNVEWINIHEKDLIQNDIYSNEIKISQPGNYKVKFGSCNTEHEFTVDFKQMAKILNLKIENNSVTINTDVNADCQYSLDGINWQTSSVFNNLKEGSYTVYAKSEELCEIATAEFVLQNTVNIITPNGDGFNDFFELISPQNVSSKITITNRYGKILVQEEFQDTFSWNGKYNGRVVPSDDYWYWVEDNNGNQTQGHITIKNR